MGALGFLGKVIAFLLLIVLIVVLPAILWTYNIQAVLFDRSTYENIIDNRSLYTTLLPAALPRFVDDMAVRSSSTDAQFSARLFRNLDSADWQEITALLFPVEWIQDQIDQNADALFEWIDSTDVLPDFKVDLTTLKSRLTGSEGVEVIDRVVGTWPACTPDQADTVEAVLDEEIDAEQFPACQPEDSDLHTRMTDTFMDGLDDTANIMPDEPSTDETALTDRQQQQWLSLKVFIRLARRVGYLIFLIPAVLLLLILILAVRSFKSLMRWYGWGLFVGGLLGLLLLLPVSFSPLLAWQLASGSQEVDIALLPALLALTGIMGKITQPILIQGGAITVAGFLFLGLASLIKSDKPDGDADEVG